MQKFSAMMYLAALIFSVALASKPTSTPKPQPTAFEQALGGWKNSKLRICHLETQKYFVSTTEQEDTCRGRGGYVAFATPEEREKVKSTDSGVPLERDAIREHMVNKKNPAPDQRSYDPLAN